MWCHFNVSCLLTLISVILTLLLYTSFFAFDLVRASSLSIWISELAASGGWYNFEMHFWWICQVFISYMFAWVAWQFARDSLTQTDRVFYICTSGIVRCCEPTVEPTVHSIWFVPYIFYWQRVTSFSVLVADLCMGMHRGHAMKSSMQAPHISVANILWHVI